MRLLHTETRRLREFAPDKIPPYAILSHTWGHDEVTFGDINEPCQLAKSKLGYKKIDLSCNQALSEGIAWMWIDSCCIDKSSSAELSETINSMFRYYEQAKTCYAYLADLETTDPSGSLSLVYTRVDLTGIVGSSFIGADHLSRITRIRPNIIKQYANIKTASVAQRMSWAATRQTTRVEDLAYSLLGIFDVHMALLYGEGTRAFLRLQDEVLKKTDDQSIFAWSIKGLGDGLWHGLFADSPDQFMDCQHVESPLHHKDLSLASMTSSGLAIRLPLAKVSGELFEARLNCSIKGDRLSIFVQRIPGTASQYTRTLASEVVSALTSGYRSELLHVRQQLPVWEFREFPSFYCFVVTIPTALDPLQDFIYAGDEGLYLDNATVPVPNVASKKMRLTKWGSRKLMCALVLHAHCEHDRFTYYILIGTFEYLGTLGCSLVSGRVVEQSRLEDVEEKPLFQTLQQLYKPRRVAGRCKLYNEEAGRLVSVRSGYDSQASVQIITIDTHSTRDTSSRKSML